jgi:purine-binding chemotaxis protein CheW
VKDVISQSQRQVCAFTLGEHLFGIDIEFVQEVLRFQECTPIPMTPALVTGLLNLRGKIVMAIDLRQRLGIDPRSETKPPTNIVVRLEDGSLSFLVDELFDILTLGDEQFEQVPDTLTKAEKRFVTGCYKLDTRLLIMLDATQVADISSVLREGMTTTKAAPTATGHPAA